MHKGYVSVHARRPWDYAVEPIRHTHRRGGGDTPEQIAYCLHCKLPPRYYNTCRGPEQAKEAKATWEDGHG